MTEATPSYGFSVTPDYSTTPNQENPRMVAGIKRYVEHGIRPGDFLTALFSNDLTRTFSHADEKNYPLVGEWVRWMYNEMPSNMVGSQEIMEAYLRSRDYVNDSYESSDVDYGDSIEINEDGEQVEKLI